MASPAIEWSTWDSEAVLRQMQSDPQGLTSEEAKRRLKKFGFNQLPSRSAPSVLKIFLRQFRSSLIYLLLIAALLSLFLGDLTDFGFILVVLLFNAAIGTFHETHAERTSLALQKLISTQAVVLRDGRICTVKAEQLVPGDIVLVESGATVPADIRLIRSLQLESNESLVTGESMPVPK
ncbi:MAG: hypothetical protein RJB13_1402, partial [Pseudomonadota bacterium]